MTASKQHYTEEELILHHYGESADPEAVEAHLGACGRCSAELEAIASVLDIIEVLPIPERSADYARQVWDRIRPRMYIASLRLSWKSLAAVAAVAAVVVAAFLIGREVGERNGVEALTVEARQRILMLAVDQHLERSERVLTEVVNSKSGPSLDLGAIRANADRLVMDNRIYRATAQGHGADHLVDVLDELERVLLEISNGSSTPSVDEFNAMWRRIEGSGLRIRIRIMQNEARQRTRGTATPRLNANEI